MKPRCPVFNNLPHPSGSKIIRDGSFFRPSDGRKIQRYKCKQCGKRFSSAAYNSAYRQNKRRVNFPLKQLFASGTSQRRAAKLLRINKNTVAKKLIYLGRQARKEHDLFLAKNSGIEKVQFDELQTIEHTKLKPLSIVVMVKKQDRKLLGLEVSSMGATGHLAKLSRKKYGKRKDTRTEGLRDLFTTVKPALAETVAIESDEHPLYLPAVRSFFPKSIYTQYKGAKSCVSGQGELKKLVFDPLFSINHTLAMLRANINRLFRKTWNTTKDPERLKDHLYLYMNYHNQVLT